MNKPSILSSIIAVVLVLSFTAQGLLLTPHLVATWFQVLPQGVHFIFGGLAFLFGLFLLLAFAFDYRRLSLNIILLTNTVLLAGLGIIYLQSGLIADALPLALLVTSLLAFIFIRGPRTRSASFDWLLAIAPVFNILFALGILFFPSLIIPEAHYGRVIQDAPIVGVAHALTGVFGLAATLRQGVITRSWVARLLALPWLGWCILFAIPPFSLPSILPAGALAVALLLYNLMPWERLILPEEDVLGHRIIRLTVIANVAVLAAITILIVIGENNLAGDPVEGAALRIAREIALVCFNLFALASLYAVMVVNISVNGLMRTATTEEVDEDAKRWNLFVDQLVGPLTLMQSTLRKKVRWQERQIKSLNEQLGQERTRAIQFSLIKELSQQLEPVLDHTVSSQLTANVLQRAFGSVLVTVFKYEAEKSDFALVAAAGQKTATIPPGYRQSLQKGVIGRAGRTRKPQLVNNTAEDPDFITLEQQSFLAEMAVPLIYKNQVKGMIVINDEHVNAYNANDIDTVDSAASQLLASWERSDYDTRLAQLVDGGIALATILDPEAALDQIAIIAQKILGAHFVYVIKQDRKNDRFRTANAGYAPPLLGYLQRDPGGNELIQNALSNGTPFRIRDVRKEFPNLLTGFIHLRTALVMPLRLRNDSRGAILAFGKQGELTFTDSDEALGHLLSNQATAALDTAELHEEISDMLHTATTLNLLSTRVIQSEKVTDAAAAIAESARRLGNASASGIVLYTETGQVQAQVQIDASGISPGSRHPFLTIRQSMESGERIIQSWEGQTSICLPLQTPHRQYGTLWLDIANDIWQQNQHVDNLQTLANQAAIALERSLLLVETTEKSAKISAAYDELQETYRQTLVALTSALDARDRETEGHSMRVTQMSLVLAKILGMSDKQLEVLERGALLHDIGKIGISDTILHKPGKLSEAEWVEMRKHPDIGARIVSGIPFLQDAIPVILYHQERWDGSGYPVGLKGQEIPLLARIFAVVDTFDALTSIRPYRTRISPQEAAQYIKEQAYIQYDPDVVRALHKALDEGSILGLMAD